MLLEFYDDYRQNIHSQNGEDGILRELLSRLNIKSGNVCEFGTLDGVKYSNTFNLVKQGFNAVYIESDESYFKELQKLQTLHPNINAINKHVDHVDGSDNLLDNILKETDLPIDFDILSIDIDSYDYHVWKSFKNYTPKIVIIEINSSIRPNVEGHIHEEGVFELTSFLPMLKLGIEKGYKFVLHTGNMIFIKEEYFEQLKLENISPEQLFRYNWIRGK